MSAMAVRAEGEGKAGEGGDDSASPSGGESSKLGGEKAKGKSAADERPLSPLRMHTPNGGSATRRSLHEDYVVDGRDGGEEGGAAVV